jgi:hypothetical protein
VGPLGDQRTVNINTKYLLFHEAIILHKIIGMCLFSTTISSKNLDDDGISLPDAFVEDECDEMILAEEETDNESEDPTHDNDKAASSLPSLHSPLVEVPSISSCRDILIEDNLFLLR